MTWNPRRKNHLTHRPTFAQPLLSISEDTELDMAVQRFIHVEETLIKLTKETKRYLKAIAALDRADKKLSTNLSTCGLVHINDELRRIVENYHSITTQVGKTVQEMTILSHNTFIEPLNKLRDKFALVAEALARREELVSTWKLAYNKVKKLQEKKDRTASHIARLEKEKRAEEVAAKELKAVHSQLLLELPWFLEKRLEYIKPSVHALIMIQLDYYGENIKLFNDCLSPNNDSTADECDSSIMEQMNKIKHLTIVKGH